MRPGDPDDPLLRQVLPLSEELSPAPGFDIDPVDDSAAELTPGVLQKYNGRALLVTTGACAVHCRYCFRRHFPYAEHQIRGESWQDALVYIAGDPSISEVILSGGDPLSVSDARLAEMLGDLAGIPHLRRLRIHTRLPIVLPSRVDEGLLEALATNLHQLVVVVHANHAQEIDGEVAAALERLRGARATVLNQAVLLAGVNDEAGALCELSETLFAAGVLPYYLHLLDRVSGAAHFAVDEERARRLVGEMTARLPGYLVPRLVREMAGAPSKVPLLPELPEKR
jgi:EF-P beta-lysylation protein EpmB